VGWKILEQFCADEGIALEAALARLSAKNVKAAGRQTLREIAVNNGFNRPSELLAIMRGE
jgi:hypothetical protein